MFAAAAGLGGGNKALWLKADCGVVLDGSSKVSRWVDQSGNNRNFTASGSGLVVLPNWKNSLPAIQNPGTGYCLQHSAFFSGSQQSEAFVILDSQYSSSQGGWGHFGTNPNGSQYPYNSAGSKINEHYGLASPNVVQPSITSTQQSHLTVGVSGQHQ